MQADERPRFEATLASLLARALGDESDPEMRSAGLTPTAMRRAFLDDATASLERVSVLAPDHEQRAAVEAVAVRALALLIGDLGEGARREVEPCSNLDRSLVGDDWKWDLEHAFPPSLRVVREVSYPRVVMSCARCRIAWEVEFVGGANVTEWCRGFGVKPHDHDHEHADHDHHHEHAESERVSVDLDPGPVPALELDEPSDDLSMSLRDAARG